MRKRTTSQNRWIMVHVWRGMPTDIQVFGDKGIAVRRERLLRRALPPEDEIALFEVHYNNDVGKMVNPCT